MIPQSFFQDGAPIDDVLEDYPLPRITIVANPNRDDARRNPKRNNPTPHLVLKAVTLRQRFLRGVVERLDMTFNEARGMAWHGIFTYMKAINLRQM